MAHSANVFKILDCTLRDGGYYNDWDFELPIALRLVQGLVDAGVECIELGYKSPAGGQFYGLFKYCPESELKAFSQFKDKTEFSFMLDAKEFFKGKTLDPNAVSATIPRATQSLFTLCRIATVPGDLEPTLELASQIRTLGYKVGLNIMGASLLSPPDFKALLQKVSKASLDVFYFADSFGGLGPEEIAAGVKLIQEILTCPIGVHTHDNKGLAYANALAAIRAGATWIDSTVTGMGRGAGNLKTEQMLLSAYFDFEQKHHNGFSLLEVIDKDFRPLQNKHRWGWDFDYMLSGLQNIHPTYCQKLKSNHQYTLKQVSEILSAIPAQNRTRFNAQELGLATTRIVTGQGSVQAGDVRLPEWKAQKRDRVLIVGAGPSAKTHALALRKWINTQNPWVIECNNTGILEGVQRTVALLNRVRHEEFFTKAPATSEIEILSGLTSVPTPWAKNKMAHLPFEIAPGKIELLKSPVVLPAFVVGMYAMAAAFQSGAKEVFLAGFDGFGPEFRNLEQAEQHREMGSFLKATGAKSLTPTTYEIPADSVYRTLH